MYMHHVKVEDPFAYESGAQRAQGFYSLSFPTSLRKLCNLFRQACRPGAASMSGPAAFDACICTACVTQDCLNIRARQHPI